jgi:hypothetical protein
MCRAHLESTPKFEDIESHQCLVTAAAQYQRRANVRNDASLHTEHAYIGAAAQRTTVVETRAQAQGTLCLHDKMKGTK